MTVIVNNGDTMMGIIMMIILLHALSWDCLKLWREKSKVWQASQWDWETTSQRGATSRVVKRPWESWDGMLLTQVQWMRWELYCGLGWLGDTAWVAGSAQGLPSQWAQFGAPLTGFIMITIPACFIMASSVYMYMYNMCNVCIIYACMYI